MRGAEAYFRAIESSDVESLRSLLAERPALVEARTNPSYAPERQLRCTGLHIAVYADRPEIARLLLEAGIDIDARTTEGRSALHDAIEFGRETILDLLLEQGAEVDICAAAILGRLDLLRLRLDRDPGLANDRSTGLSPLGWAAFGNQVETATELIERGARMDDGELLCAASVGHVEVGRLLIERGADPDEMFDEAGGNALHAAASMRYAHDSRPFVEMLLAAGADPRLRTSNGLTPANVADLRARDQRRRRQAGEAVGHPKPFEAVAERLRRAETAQDGPEATGS